MIFVFFSAIIMLINMGMLVIGLIFNRLLSIIEEGARPPSLVNTAIMAEAGSTISLDSIAQSQNDLLIAQSLFERILTDRDDVSKARLLEDWDSSSTTAEGDNNSESSDPTVENGGNSA